jgi:hypothetical protein
VQAFSERGDFAAGGSGARDGLTKGGAVSGVKPVSR